MLESGSLAVTVKLIRCPSKPVLFPIGFNAGGGFNVDNTGAIVAQGTAAEPITFTEREIKDWGFVENGKGYGFASLRKGKDNQTPVQKQKLAAFFSPDLLPEGW